MVRDRDNESRLRIGFTLIELLVVVAIIALLISILLPSLSKARAQARGTLCASRISQLAKAMLVYADDYDETLPFLGRGWEDCDDTALLAKEWPRGSSMSILNWAYQEDWQMPKMPDYWLTPMPWPEGISLRHGDLFSYARFEGLYRCPEFERLSASGKSQELFNYTRSVLGRKWFHRGDPEGLPSSIWAAEGDDNWCGQPGPIMKMAQVYNASRLQMLVDERWDRHCAAPQEQFQQAGSGFLEGRISQQWMAIDSINGPWGNEIGQYHGTSRVSPLIPAEYRNRAKAVKSGSLVFYDGHAELDVDPLPDRSIDWDIFAGIGVLRDWLFGHIFSQRGLHPENIIFDFSGM